MHQTIDKPSYRIEITHFNNIAGQNPTFKVEKTFSIPFRRTGVESKEDPLHTKDEILRYPLEELAIPSPVLTLARKIINTKKFTPGWIANCRRIEIQNGQINIEANLTNYGVLPTLMELTRIFPDEIMRPVLDQIAPLGVHSVMLSIRNGSLYLARRVNVDCSGQLSVYPSGTVAEGYNIRTTLERESIEEAGFKLGYDGTECLIGLVRGRGDSPNPNLVYMINTPWSFKQLNLNTSRDEHDKVYAIPLDEKIIADKLKNDFIFRTPDHDRILGASVAAILLVGKTLFGNRWYITTIGNLHDLESHNIKITDEDNDEITR